MEWTQPRPKAEEHQPRVAQELPCSSGQEAGTHNGEVGLANDNSDVLSSDVTVGTHGPDPLPFHRGFQIDLHWFEPGPSSFGSDALGDLEQSFSWGICIRPLSLPPCHWEYAGEGGPGMNWTENCSVPSMIFPISAPSQTSC